MIMKVLYLNILASLFVQATGNLTFSITFLHRISIAYDKWCFLSVFRGGVTNLILRYF